MVDQIDNSQNGSALLLEEEALGAQFEQYGDIWIPQSFGNDEEMLSTHAGLINLTSCGVIQIAGSDSPLFLQTLSSGPVLPESHSGACDQLNQQMLSGEPQVNSSPSNIDQQLLLDHGIGRAIKALFLTAEAEVIDLCLILEMGGDTYTVICSPENKDELFEWLKAHAELEREGVKAFNDLTLTDLSGALTLLGFYGDKTTDILSDYLPDLTQTFDLQRSQVKPMLFDGKFPVILTHLALDSKRMCGSTSTFGSSEDVLLHLQGIRDQEVHQGQGSVQTADLYLMFITPDHSALLYRSFLSFETVCPFGFRVFRDVLLNTMLPEYTSLFEGEYRSIKEIPSFHLFIRRKHDFVGGKHLD